LKLERGQKRERLKESRCPWGGLGPSWDRPGRNNVPLIDLYHHRSPFPAPFPLNTITEQAIQAILIMSSTGQAAFSTLTIQSITDALVDYTKVTGIDLSKDPFATAIEHLNSPEAILELLQEREKAFKEYRDGNRRLISCLRPAVNIIQAFSGILGEAISQVSHICHRCSSLMTLSGPVSTGKSLVRGDRCSPCCTSLEYAFSTDVTDKYSRPQVGLHPVMTPSSSCSSAWGTSSSVSKFISRSRPPRY
jgi:hypothetical protein